MNVNTNITKTGTSKKLDYNACNNSLLHDVEIPSPKRPRHENAPNSSITMPSSQKRTIERPHIEWDLSNPKHRNLANNLTSTGIYDLILTKSKNPYALVTLFQTHPSVFSKEAAPPEHDVLYLKEIIQEKWPENYNDCKAYLEKYSAKRSQPRLPNVPLFTSSYWNEKPTFEQPKLTAGEHFAYSKKWGKSDDEYTPLGTGLTIFDNGFKDANHTFTTTFTSQFSLETEQTEEYDAELAEAIRRSLASQLPQASQNTTTSTQELRGREGKEEE